MSEQQKVYASLSGAVVAHMLLLFLAFLLIGSNSRSAVLNQAPEPAPGPREVTILMSDLMEQIEVEPPLPPEPERRARRSFFDTDTNQAEKSAPENATFISDRNTTAATELLPDPSLPQQPGPTTKGDSPLEILRLQNRDYVDGQVGRPPATRPQPQAAASRVGNSAPQSEGVRNGVESGAGEESESVEGADLSPEDPVADTKLRPAASKERGMDDESARQKSFSDPDSTVGGLPDFDDGKQDRFAANRNEEDSEKGPLADLKQKKEQNAGIADGKGNRELGNAAKDSRAGEMAPAGDAGLFADGFSPEQRQNSTNGTLTNVGRNAVDAEETAAGRYEAAVRAAIARKWHEYKSSHGDFVTYGLLKVKCRVDRNGKVHDLRVVENKANSVLTDFSLRAFLDARLPVMPGEVASEYGPKGLELNYDIIIY